MHGKLIRDCRLPPNGREYQGELEICDPRMRIHGAAAVMAIKYQESLRVAFLPELRRGVQDTPEEGGLTC